tara:strand:+ start:9517 stop:9822 length:306 start_codon:yes stop_codon:yes gene_type:complete
VSRYIILDPWHHDATFGPLGDAEIWEVPDDFDLGDGVTGETYGKIGDKLKVTNIFDYMENVDTLVAAVEVLLGGASVELRDGGAVVLQHDLDILKRLVSAE